MRLRFWRINARRKGVDLWGFCEVESRDFAETIEQRIEAHTGSDYELFVSDDQHQDKLAILYDKSRFDEINRLTLESVRLNSSGLRPMIVVHLRGKQTGREFFFGVNHLKASGGAGNIQKRVQQSKIINDWAETQVLPIVICGDFNYPYPVAPGGQPPIDFQEITADGIFQWVKPDRLVKTQQNPSFNSVLDFYFVANAIPGWEGKSRILDREGNQEGEYLFVLHVVQYKYADVAQHLLAHSVTHAVICPHCDGAIDPLAAILQKKHSNFPSEQLPNPEPYPHLSSN